MQALGNYLSQSVAMYAYFFTRELASTSSLNGLRSIKQIPGASVHNLCNVHFLHVYSSVADIKRDVYDIGDTVI